MRSAFIGLLAIVVSASAAPAFAAPPNVVSYDVGVCDPSFPLRCLKPNVDGSINTTGGAAPSATVGSAYPAVVTPNSGKNPSNGNTVAQALGTDGGWLPTQAAPATTRTTLGTATATLIDTGHTTRISIEIQTEVALTAPVFICFVQLTACSATNYDKLLPIGAAGEMYTPPFSPTGTTYAFTTQVGVILTSASWFVQ